MNSVWFQKLCSQLLYYNDFRGWGREASVSGTWRSKGKRNEVRQLEEKGKETTEDSVGQIELGFMCC